MTVLCGEIKNDGNIRFADLTDLSKNGRLVAEYDGTNKPKLALWDMNISESSGLIYHSGLTLSDKIYKYRRSA